MLTVMTYNLGNGLAPPERLVTSLRATAAHVVGLQELAAAQADAIARDLADLYPHRVLSPTGFSGKGVLSRYPLLAHDYLYLYPKRPDLHVSVDVDGVPLSIVVAHPPPPRLRRTGVVFDPAARSQVETLAALVVANAPAVLLGDLNMTTRNPAYARFASMGLIDAFRAAGTGRGSTLPARLGRSGRIHHRLERLPLRPVLRVDYIWYTAQLSAERAWVGADAGSDHLPVLARLTFAAEPERTAR